jgi:hypothetical protein
MLQTESRGLLAELQKRYVERNELIAREPEERREVPLKREQMHQAWKTKRDLTGRANGTLDPWVSIFGRLQVLATSLNKYAVRLHVARRVH